MLCCWIVNNAVCHGRSFGCNCIRNRLLFQCGASTFRVLQTQRQTRSLSQSNRAHGPRNATRRQRQTCVLGCRFQKKSLSIHGEQARIYTTKKSITNIMMIIIRLMTINHNYHCYYYYTEILPTLYSFYTLPLA